MWTINIDLWTKNGTITFGGYYSQDSNSEESYTWLPIPGYYMVSFDFIKFGEQELIVNLIGRDL